MTPSAVFALWSPELALGQDDQRGGRATGALRLYGRDAPGRGRRGAYGRSDLVPHTGFEPVISALRGRCPGPLDECGAGSWPRCSAPAGRDDSSGAPAGPQPTPRALGEA